jgi:gamma-glutamyltranspeptidase/glutathione hydrolase
VKLARDDRVVFPLQDPGADYHRLLSEEHLAELRVRLDPNRAGVSRGDWYGAEEDSDPLAKLGAEQTTHLVTADRAGNVVSLTQTLGWLFGGAAMLGDTGMLANCMLYWGFDFVPGGPNPIGPRKRPSTPMSPVIVLDPAGQREMGVGTPGGWGVPQTTIQTISNVLDFEMNIQAAVEAPRLRVDEERYVAIESRVPKRVISELERYGHDINLMDDWLYSVPSGRADLGRMAIAISDTDDGILYGGADPRGDCFALAN